MSRLLTILLVALLCLPVDAQRSRRALLNRPLECVQVDNQDIGNDAIACMAEDVASATNHVAQKYYSPPTAKTLCRVGVLLSATGDISDWTITLGIGTPASLSDSGAAQYTTSFLGTNTWNKTWVYKDFSVPMTGNSNWFVRIGHNKTGSDTSNYLRVHYNNNPSGNGTNINGKLEAYDGTSVVVSTNADYDMCLRVWFMQ